MRDSRFAFSSGSNTNLETSTKKYYNAGWALLAPTNLARMPVSQITPDDIEATRIVHRFKKGEKIISEECHAHYSDRAPATLKGCFQKLPNGGSFASSRGSSL